MRHPGGCLLLTLLAGLAPGGARGDVPSPDMFYGTTIASLSFRGDAPLNEKALAALTSLVPGKTLSPGAIRTSLRNLFATQRFADLAVEASPSPEGTSVVIVYSAAPRIAHLAITGPVLPRRGKLRDALPLGPGDPWAPDRVDTFEKSLKAVLRAQGYFAAKVDTLVEAGEDDTSVDVRFEIQAGEPARAAAPEWIGVTAPLSAADFAGRARVRQGGLYRPSRARDDADRYAVLYHKRGYARAEVRFESERYDAASNTATPRYRVFVGPLVVLTVLGAPLAEVRDHADSPWAKGEPPDEEAVHKLAEGLKRTYQEKGYARAKVDVSFDTTEEAEAAAFAIQKGARYSISRVSVQGVTALRRKDAEAVLRTQPRGLVELGRLVDQDVAQDVDAIAGLYRSEGFADVVVRKPEIADGPSPFTLDVTFRVEEGRRTLVGGRQLTGASLIPAAELERLVELKPGSPFNEPVVYADLARLRAAYLDRGFVDSRVESEVKISRPDPPAPQQAFVTYTIVEGEPVTFGKTIIRGNRTTRTSIIRRDLAHAEGQPFSLTKLLDTQQNLSRLGVFQTVELSSFPTDLETRSRAVAVTVAESKPWSFLYGLGAEYDENASPRLNPRLSFSATYGNLFGRALSVGGEFRYSPRDKRAVFTAADRDLFNVKIPIRLSVFTLNDVRPDFEVRRRGAFIQGEKRLTSALKVALAYQYEIVTPTAANPAILSTLERENQQISISSIGPGLLYDTRDDQVDPRSGVFATANLKYAFPLFAADARFLKLAAQATLYRPWRKTRFALSVRAGGIVPFGPCDPVVTPGCPPNLQVPIAERLFAGGRSSHRAFGLDQLGIDGETVSVAPNGTRSGYGGNGLLVANFEWRIPVFGGFGVAIFVDAGNVWADVNHIELSQIRTGAGLGLHYLTPVGPIRLEYGLKLDKKPTEDAGAFSFSIGFPF
jgi:outer membrane protein insertion porin family